MTDLILRIVSLIMAMAIAASPVSLNQRDDIDALSNDSEDPYGTVRQEAQSDAADPGYFAFPEENEGPVSEESSNVSEANYDDKREEAVELGEGFFFRDGELFYADESGNVRTSAGWMNLNGNAYYSDENGAFFHDRAIDLGGFNYRFDGSGKLLLGFHYWEGNLNYQDPVTFERRSTVGWFTVDGKTYFSDKDGNIYHNMFIHTSETDYYWMSEDGSVCPNSTVVIGGIPYDLDGTGMVVKTGGWGETAEGRRYYKNPASGMPLSRIFTEMDGEEYYFGPDSLAAVGWNEVEGRWMYFDEETSARIYGRFDENALNGFNGQYYYTKMPGMSYGCCTGFVGFMVYNLMGIEDYPHTVSTASHRNGGEYVDAHMIWLMENADLIGYATTENRQVIYHGDTYQPGDIIIFNTRSDAYLGELSPGISSPNFDTFKVDGYAVLEHVAIVGWNTSGVPEGQYNMHHNTSSRNIINEDSPEQFIRYSPANSVNDGRSRSYYVFRLRPEGYSGEEPEEPEE